MGRGMLVIKVRRNGEVYIFDENGKRARVVVLGCTSSMVTLGIAAPSEMTVERKEVNERRMALAGGR